jgi:hypothetical protein
MGFTKRELPRPSSPRLRGEVPPKEGMGGHLRLETKLIVLVEPFPPSPFAALRVLPPASGEKRALINLGGIV